MIPVTAEKKDPGKFTVRFNPEDPQQRTVIRVLNRQGRYKAQFLTSAVRIRRWWNGSCGMC